MTENEAIERFCSCQENNGMCEKCKFEKCCGIYDMEDLAIKALEEVQEYRKIGTVEELKAASKYLWLVKKHGTVGKAIEACAEYEEIGSLEECRAAIEKQKTEKPMEEWGIFGNPEEKDLDRLTSMHHKIIDTKFAEIVTEQEMIALLRAKDAVRKQIRKPVKNLYGTSYIWKAGYCPVCGCGVTARWDYCQCCGQKLERED